MTSGESGADIIELLGSPKGKPISYTVADATTVTKGDLMKLSADPRTAAITAGRGDLFNGFAAADKEISDGATRLALNTCGIFDLTVAGAPAAVTLGFPVQTSGANVITDADDDVVEGMAKVIGYSLETGAADEKIAVICGVLH